MSYAVIMYDNVPELAKDWGPGLSLSGKWIMLFIFGLVLFGLSSAKRLSFLRYTSGISAFASLYLVFVVCYEFFSKRHCPAHSDSLVCHTIDYTKLTSTVFKALPLLTTAFNGHYSVVTVYRSMVRPRQIYVVVAVAITFVLILCAIIGIAGYLTFGDAVKSDILTMYTTGGFRVSLAKAAVCLSVIAAYALNIFASRISVNTFLQLIKPAYQPTWPKDVLITAVLVPATIIITLVMPQQNALGVVLDYNGALFANAICYTMPGLALLRLSETSLEKTLAIVLIVSGLLLTATGVIVTTLEIAKGNQ
eukprot:NODE_4117_length_1113_cov_148.046465_g3921_i0.p1 GENE.NODE_4117_length_1113_cov_148.046465_g3921_i0~~NODE_4117_length_1113_cov_148.046465_g3921_i0.p1  ORF type:complete len:322 (-),score=38.43 NODE_4117_length_1113_cov_148.046465_g3921_i0:148-1068(-)